MAKMKKPLDLDACHDAFKKQKGAIYIPPGGVRLARAHNDKFTKACFGERPLKRFEYMLARWVRAHLGDMRYPYLNMKCKAFELWVYDDGHVCVRLIDVPVGPLVLSKLEHTIGRARAR